MKSILFIGKFNTVYENIYHFLKEYYEIDVVNGHLDSVKGVVKMKTPDLVLISLINLNDVEEIIELIKAENSHQHFLVFGNSMELIQISRYREDRFVSDMERPFDFNDLLYRMKLILKEDATRPVQKNKKKKVLIIDDNKLQLKVMSQMLSPDYQVSVVTSASQALMLIGKNRPDVIFLDYDMPGMDGKQALEMFREIDDINEIPIYFLTGLSDRSHINAVLPLKPAGYLLKPVSKERICQEIEKATSKKATGIRAEKSIW